MRFKIAKGILLIDLTGLPTQRSRNSQRQGLHSLGLWQALQIMR